MPTVKKSLSKRPVYSDAQIEFLRTGDYSGSDEKFFFSCDDAAVRQAWKALRDDLLRGWIEEHPGTRPWGWWTFDAPRWTRKFDAYYDGTLPEPRLRVGGIGTPAFEALNVVPAFTRGIPDSWVSAFDVSFYNGRSVDIHGQRIGTKYTEGRFPHDAIDPEDPPVFESEASYLKRFGLFLRGEKKRVPADAYQPEVVTEEDDAD
jgi:hypothetical protein